MFSEKIRLDGEVISTSASKTSKDNQEATHGYRAPELHVVGKACELVQGNFGYTGRDGSYYYS